MKRVNHFLVLIQSTPPDAEHRGCCPHKVVAVGFKSLDYDAERRGMKPSARIKNPHGNAIHTERLFPSLQSPSFADCRRKKENADDNGGYADVFQKELYMVLPGVRHVIFQPERSVY